MGTCGRVEARNIHFIMPEKKRQIMLDKPFNG